MVWAVGTQFSFCQAGVVHEVATEIALAILVVSRYSCGTDLPLKIGHQDSGASNAHQDYMPQSFSHPGT